MRKFSLFHSSVQRIANRRHRSRVSNRESRLKAIFIRAKFSVTVQLTADIVLLEPLGWNISYFGFLSSPTECIRRCISEYTGRAIFHYENIYFFLLIWTSSLWIIKKAIVSGHYLRTASRCPIGLWSALEGLSLKDWKKIHTFHRSAAFLKSYRL